MPVQTVEAMADAELPKVCCKLGSTPGQPAVAVVRHTRCVLCASPSAVCAVRRGARVVVLGAVPRLGPEQRHSSAGGELQPAHAELCPCPFCTLQLFQAGQRPAAAAALVQHVPTLAGRCKHALRPPAPCPFQVKTHCLPCTVISPGSSLRDTCSMGGAPVPIHAASSWFCKCPPVRRRKQLGLLVLPASKLMKAAQVQPYSNLLVLWTPSGEAQGAAGLACVTLYKASEGVAGARRTTY